MSAVSKKLRSPNIWTLIRHSLPAPLLPLGKGVGGRGCRLPTYGTSPKRSLQSPDGAAEVFPFRRYPTVPIMIQRHYPESHLPYGRVTNSRTTLTNRGTSAAHFVGSGQIKWGGNSVCETHLICETQNPHPGPLPKKRERGSRNTNREAPAPDSRPRRFGPARPLRPNVPRSDRRD